MGAGNCWKIRPNITNAGPGRRPRNKYQARIRIYSTIIIYLYGDGPGFAGMPAIQRASGYPLRRTSTQTGSNLLKPLPELSNPNQNLTNGPDNSATHWHSTPEPALPALDKTPPSANNQNQPRGRKINSRSGTMSPTNTNSHSYPLQSKR